MSSKIHSMRYCAWACAAWLASATAQSASDPTDPSADVPPTTYESVFGAGAGQYLQEVDKARLPWPKLFDSTGEFRPEASLEAPNTSPATEPPRPRVPSVLTDSAPHDSDALGVVKSIDFEQGKVKLKHGPIAKLDMPAMTMVFRVKDPSILANVKKGDEVAFTTNVEGNAFFVKTIRPLIAKRAATAGHEHASQPKEGGHRTSHSDARGVIKSIDASRGRVKLKHGPIAKHDMPGMTMIFRVKDPNILSTVKAGDEVGFTTEVEANVFFVTGFQP